MWVHVDVESETGRKALGDVSRFTGRRLEVFNGSAEIEESSFET